MNITKLALTGCVCGWGCCPGLSLAGAYRLRLDDHAERCVATALLRASLEEGEWRTDPQRGINWRNTTLDSAPLPPTTLSALDAFSLPEAGVLELDYVTAVPEVVRSQRAERMQKAKGAVRGLGRKLLLKHMSPSSKGRALGSMLQVRVLNIRRTRQRKKVAETCVCGV